MLNVLCLAMLVFAAAAVATASNVITTRQSILTIVTAKSFACTGYPAPFCPPGATLLGNWSFTEVGGAVKSGYDACYALTCFTEAACQLSV